MKLFVKGFLTILLYSIVIIIVVDSSSSSSSIIRSSSCICMFTAEMFGGYYQRLSDNKSSAPFLVSSQTSDLLLLRQFQFFQSVIHLILTLVFLAWFHLHQL